MKSALEITRYVSGPQEKIAILTKIFFLQIVLGE
jgi:hypothetical protein